MKARIKELTSRSNGWGNERRKEALRQYIIGWVNYFKLADVKTAVQNGWMVSQKVTDGYLETMETDKNQNGNLIKLGIEKYKA